MGVKVIESYGDWRPPLDVKAVIERLLSRLPERYLIGLGSVVLTSAGSLSGRRRRRKTRSRRKKVAIAQCRGLYHQKWNNEPAWIELFVDNIVPERRPARLRLAPVREFTLGEVLYHEIGHHLHYTQAPEYREKEDVAEEWGLRLLLDHVVMRNWYWYPLLMALWPWLWLRAVVRRRLRRRRGASKLAGASSSDSET